MDARQRNRVLVIGGALILIALLLVCGPLDGRFGWDRSTRSELPPVAGEPPEGAEVVTEVADADAVDAVTGAVPLMDEGAGDAIDLADEGIAAAVVTPAVAAADASSSGSVASSAGAAASPPPPPPPVSAAAPPPSPPVSAAAPPSPEAGSAAVAASAAAAGAGVAAAQAFDEALDSGGGAGPAAARFAPPVGGDSPLQVALASQPFGFYEDSPLRPCDTPGSGCRNLIGGVGPTPPNLQTPPPIYGGRIPPGQR
jgi:hypothetical protein